MAPAEQCPKCGSNLTRAHCNSKTCDIVACLRCKGSGTRNGKRWKENTVR